MLFSWLPSISWPRLQGTLATLLALGVTVFPLPSLALEDLDLPEDIGLPSRRQAGGTRGPCITDKSGQLLPIIPKFNIGRTLKDSPTLFVYLPQHTTDQGILILQELDQEKLAQSGLTLANLAHHNQDQFLKAEFKSPVSLNQESGILGVSLGEHPEIPKLEAGKIYLWAFQLVCNNTFSDYAQGWIQVATNTEEQATLRAKLEEAKSDRDRAKIYAQAGVWYDLLMALAQLRQTTSSEEQAQATTDWKSILTHPQVELDQIVDAPLLSESPTSTVLAP
ncbi:MULTISPECIES: DUF928 domain-containing protein [unclassified Roseofilum]|uniref:DUF928 domain-containing protein n=1 Tax=unclassified Roseofilum TaxID=2620099 RepID=UPI000E840C65|nr:MULTISPECIES: DUF928 domain-containing protein [unclassified Roseofilum]HBQ98287.1 hypothetical protein [Cyanobacteria bacterium UBA11691]MBP0007317.1 DUF928 domain-containing protein [Roseofilum sp. Belize Diploria]MBP0013185.1 DUF928 domain-containing protein [Roseofilum sp. SID3]MBP0023238.1 DUF928 domain-containing protein [Roseofilum sp. SID2]MBP0032527.1 DUF928 domain-containing protein [Roseofilum sp. Belize BBD 4]